MLKRRDLGHLGIQGFRFLGTWVSSRQESASFLIFLLCGGLLNFLTNWSDGGFRIKSTLFTELSGDFINQIYIEYIYLVLDLTTKDQNYQDLSLRVPSTPG
jgi:hypothetical protein